MAPHAIGRLACQLDSLLAKQRRIADERTLEALLACFAHDARALLFVAIDKDRVGIRGLELDHIGGEIDLAGFGGDVGDDLDTARSQFLHQVVAAALAEVVVHPDQRDRLGLQFVADVVRDLRHADLLPERRAEQIAIAQACQFAGFATDEMGDFGLLQERHGGLDVAGEDRPEDHVGIAVDCLLHLGARNARIGLGVQDAERDLLLEDATLGVDFLNRQDNPVTEISAGHRDATRNLADIGEPDVGGSRGAWDQHQR